MLVEFCACITYRDKVLAFCNKSVLGSFGLSCQNSEYPHTASSTYSLLSKHIQYSLYLNIIVSTSCQNLNTTCITSALLVVPLHYWQYLYTTGSTSTLLAVPLLYLQYFYTTGRTSSLLVEILHYWKYLYTNDSTSTLLLRPLH